MLDKLIDFLSAEGHPVLVSMEDKVDTILSCHTQNAGRIDSNSKAGPVFVRRLQVFNQLYVVMKGKDPERQRSAPRPAELTSGGAVTGLLNSPHSSQEVFPLFE